MTRHPLTKAGVERLREELARLKKVDRPHIIAAIAEARAHGDLRENAEYHAAKEQQGFIEGRIQHLEYTISHAQIIDVARLNPGSKVVFGATVKLADNETGGKPLTRSSATSRPTSSTTGSPSVRRYRGP